MKKFQASQLAKMVLFLLLIVIPFTSTSMRPSYLYFILNILIVVIGVEAGFLTAISGPYDERKAVKVAPITIETPPDNGGWGPSTSTSPEVITSLPVKPASPAETTPAVDKRAAVGRVNKLKRCPSMPSLFFIGSCEVEEELKDIVEEEKEKEEEMLVEVEEVGDLSGQELFAKAEMFIGNFYKQLKMQREESWKKIHGLYHTAF